MPRAGDTVINRPPPDPVTPVTDLLAATLAVYLRTFRPLFVTAALLTLVLSTVGAILLPQPDAERPESIILVLFASVIFQAVNIGVLSVVLWRAAALHRGEAPSLTATLAMVLVLGPRCFAGAMVLSLPLFVLLTAVGPLALPAFGVIVFVWIRTSLYVPAIVLEDRSIAGAFVRSWKLIGGRWMRTFLLELILVVPIFVLTFAIGLLLAGSSIPVMVGVDAVATGIFVPFLSVFGLLLFEDYSRASAGKKPPELSDRPPADEPPR
ncbi:MAG: hypothetical protein IIC32_08125 [Chloroflexi bacterium]|nr:hypothetical protein [Chloroflexota bacterium]